MMLRTCVVCSVPCNTGRCAAHPKLRSPSSKAINSAAYRNARKRVLRRDDYTCSYCGVRARHGMQVDHVVPVSKGGSHDDTNLVACCPACNAQKGAGEKNRSGQRNFQR